MRLLLLVEDGISYFDTLRWTLRRNGYVVDCVAGAQEALDYLRLAGPLGLIILHCRRPDPDLLARLKQAGPPVVIGTAPAGDSELLAAVRAQLGPDSAVGPAPPCAE